MTDDCDGAKRVIAYTAEPFLCTILPGKGGMVIVSFVPADSINIEIEENTAWLSWLYPPRPCASTDDKTPVYFTTMIVAIAFIIWIFELNSNNIPDLEQVECFRSNNKW